MTRIYDNDSTTTRMMMTAMLGPDDGNVDAAGPADASCIVWAFWYGIYFLLLLLLLF